MTCARRYDLVGSPPRRLPTNSACVAEWPSLTFGGQSRGFRMGWDHSQLIRRYGRPALGPSVREEGHLDGVGVVGLLLLGSWARGTTRLAYRACTRNARAGAPIQAARPQQKPQPIPFPFLGPLADAGGRSQRRRGVWGEWSQQPAVAAEIFDGGGLARLVERLCRSDQTDDHTHRLY